jgi:hypothetical protein
LLCKCIRRTLSTPDMDEMSIPKRPPPMHAKVPTKYCVEVRAYLETTDSAGTYGVGRYCSAVLQVDIDKTRIET